MKRKSSWSYIGTLILVVVVSVLLIGLVVKIVGDVNDKIDNIGGTTKKPQTTATTIAPTDCKNHEYKDGVCIKCGTVCPHEHTSVSDNGNTYCSTCGILRALKAPIMTVMDNVVSWTAISDATGYCVSVGNRTYDVTGTSYTLTIDKAGTYEISVEAVNGGIVSAASNIYEYVLYSVDVDLTALSKVNGTSDFSTVVATGKDYVLLIEPAMVDYSLPDDITVLVGGKKLVKGVGYTYVIGSYFATLTIPSASINGNISITGIGVEKTQTLTVEFEIDNGSLEYESNPVLGQHFVCRVSARVGYILPTSIRVWMSGEELSSSQYLYDSVTGSLTVYNVTGDIGVSGTCTTTADELAVPTGLALNGTTLTWNAVSGATSYVVRVMNTGAGFDERFTATGTTFNLATCGIMESGTYYIAVWASNADGFGEAASIEYEYSASILKLDTPHIQLV